MNTLNMLHSNEHTMFLNSLKDKAVFQAKK